MRKNSDNFGKTEIKSQKKSFAIKINTCAFTRFNNYCYFCMKKHICVCRMTEKIRIKDIAQQAGVSVGTVDRVLHDRPNVSKVAREKVEKALAEMNYQPNMYASALAYNKSYVFYLL